MMDAGHIVRVKNPFLKSEPSLIEVNRLTSPYVGRVRAMWSSMRAVVVENFPEIKARKMDTNKSIKLINDIHIQDAYHSLTIEGYQVTEELISKIESGNWSPEENESDRAHADALATKGYYGAFLAIVESVKRVLSGENPGLVAEESLQNWYKQLFIPLVQSQLLRPETLAGYRDSQVYIQGSRHVPPGKQAVSDVMETLFSLLKDEDDVRVKAVLGHFIFVFIHPYMDGNGRLGRFLMNLMLISGGYNWTVIRNSKRSEYISALEAASVDGDISKFSQCLADEMNYWMEKFTSNELA
jgi:Fic family protein